MNVTRETLNNFMEFDHVIRVHPDGTVSEPEGIYAPELHEGELSGNGWTLLNGYSGQQGYRGPIMHASEFIGGGMADDILSAPGLYVSLVDGTDDGEPEGWAVAFTPAHLDQGHPEGYLYDCPACEDHCHCKPDAAQCIYSGEHRQH